MRRGFLALTVLVIAACGTLNGPRTGAVSPPTDALAHWRDFPADRVPRPIVLLNQSSPGEGFDTNDLKIAWICAKFTITVPMPAAATADAIVTWPDGTSATYPGASAADGFAALTHPATGTANSECQRVAPLPVTSIRLGAADFTTDRGVVRMPAWLFKATGAWAEFQRPAIAQSAFWNASFEASIGGGATVSADGRQLSFGFVGGPADGPCAVDYTGVVAESPRAVAVAVQANPGRVQAGPIACDAVGHLRSVTVVLAGPLGGRVLLDASGAVVQACPEAIRAGCF